MNGQTSDLTVSITPLTKGIPFFIQFQIRMEVMMAGQSSSRKTFPANVPLRFLTMDRLTIIRPALNFRCYRATNFSFRKTARFSCPKKQNCNVVTLVNACSGFQSDYNLTIYILYIIVAD